MSPLNSFLAGLRVLDLSQYIPGPMASLILADMGAVVLKIEPPQGDEMRNLGPKDQAGSPVFYNTLNAGKTVRRMDLKNAAVRGEFLELVRDSDVLIEGFRPGVMKRLGIDYAVLKAINSGLIYCALSGYGANGASATKAAHDGNYLADSGMLDRNGDGAPMFFDPPLSDTSGALFAAIAILGALHGRLNTGHGCEIDLGLADVLMPLQLMQIADFAATAHVPKRRTTYLNGGAAYYQIYATSEGRHVMLGAVEPKFWRAFCAAAGRMDWVERQSEPHPQIELTADLSTFFATQALDAIETRFAGIDCCLSPILDLEQALGSEQTRSRRLVQKGASPGDLQALFPAYVDGKPPRLRQPATNFATPAGILHREPAE